jgi:hypothetical protein
MPSAPRVGDHVGLRVVAALAAVVGLVAGLAGCGPEAAAGGGRSPSPTPDIPSATPTTPAWSTPTPQRTPVPLRPAPTLPVAGRCPSGTTNVPLLPETRAEVTVLQTLRVCSGTQQIVVINAGPLVWVIDEPALTDNRRTDAFAVGAFRQAVASHYGHLGVVPILPGEQLGLSNVDVADLHLRLDADVQSLWIVASELTASLPDQLTEKATSEVRNRNAKLVATCSLESLSASRELIKPNASDALVTKLLLTSAATGCLHEFSELDSSTEHAVPGAVPVEKRLAQRATTLELSRPTAAAEGWAIRFLRFITVFGARAHG